eukprot:CAMPEP_0171815718 /NCGR_PEP_ID=MMETSP0992-20121227/63_1 /TAXON_ID=483369 /ORGANISM="non described non described, Strain CCMP2098" /LENGTH=86 /DNA_ID=CAMNT_0012429421 /DNA_START=197 /DNA_END=454 /DNA_ORIENTATION=-
MTAWAAWLSCCLVLVTSRRNLKISCFASAGPPGNKTTSVVPLKLATSPPLVFPSFDDRPGSKVDSKAPAPTAKSPSPPSSSPPPKK